MSGPRDAIPPFPPVAYAEWRALVERDLHGGSFTEELVRATLAGVDVAPLYVRADRPGGEAHHGAPGAAPYTRGAAAPDAPAGWDLRPEIAHPDPAVVRGIVAKELARGATSVMLALDPAGARGIAVRSADDLALALADVDLARTRVALKAGGRFASSASQLRETWRRRGVADAEARADLLADPYGAWVADGAAPGGIAALMGEMTALAVEAARDLPQVRAVKASSCPFHDAGADSAWELACLLAEGAAYLEALDAAGLGVDAAAPGFHLCVSLDARQFGGVAKLRALRTVWSRLVEACGGGEAARRPRVHARTSARMMAVRDPWTNLLRTTSAAFAAAVGGADVITVAPHDAAAGVPDAVGRRLARNVGVILREESHLDRVLDPAGGTWHLEARTDGLAEKAWSHFQTIMQRGGLAACLRDGWLQARIAETAAARERDVARRRLPLIGVSEYPDLDAELPARPRPAASGSAAPALAAGDAEPGDSIRPLTLRRLAEPYEALRDASDRHRERTGERPRAFLASLGPVARHSARAGFARNLLAAGGIAAAANDGFPDADAAAAAFRADGARLAVICGCDDDYAALAGPAAAALKAAGARTVVLAGRLGEREREWRDAGVDLEIRLGCDALAVLRELHERLEVAR